MFVVDDDALSAPKIIELLELEPHPEGGFYKETFRDSEGGARGYSTAIYYLLEKGDCSKWHRVRDAVEIWHYYAGAPMCLTLSQNGVGTEKHHLGSDINLGQRPQLVVQKDCWQTAKSLGAWTLVGCSVAPGFDFSGFEMAPEDWHPEVS